MYIPSKVFRDHGVTQKEVAERMGVSAVSIMSMMKGNPKLSSVQKMADAVGADFLEFFVPMSKDDEELKHFLNRFDKFDVSEFSPRNDGRKNKIRASQKDAPVKTASDKAKDAGGEPAV